MKTSGRTTYILLERGHEDVAMLEQLDELFNLLLEKSGLSNSELVYNYRTLWDLRLALRDETTDSSHE